MPHFRTKTSFAAFLCTLTVIAIPWRPAEAVSIGDVASQSRLGKPLQVRINLRTGPNERIDEACLALLPPDPREGDSYGFVTRATLSIKTEGQRQYIVISSSKPFNDAVARFRLQIRCPGAGSITRTLTILPEPDLSVLLPQDDSSPALTPVPAPALQPETEADKIVAAKKADVPQDAPEAIARPPIAKPPPPKKRHVRPRSEGQGTFRLKLSGEPLDASRIGQISPEERAALLAQQKLLDADDQTASFLALQHQVKQLQDELGQIKLQLAQLGAAPVAALPTSAPPSAPVTVPAPTARPKPASAKPVPVSVQQEDYSLELLAALGLIAALFILGWTLRRQPGLKSHLEKLSRHKTKATADAPSSAPAATTPVLRTVQPRPAPAEAPTPPPALLMGDMDNEETVTLPPADEEKKEISEEEAMLEEARLYIAHGRPAKSVEILQELTRVQPQNADAWSLLLSLYSSLGKAAEFGETARAFLQHHKDSPAWSGIQALGRTLDPDNPLYADQQGAAARLLTTGQRRQIGDVLMEMGVLSPQDLQNCLDDYDPKKHGRFGGYLVARRAITLAQLDQALLLQQGISPEMQAGGLPSLQDMENLLADFDPKRDGSVGEFLASRDAAATDQPGQPPQQETETASPEPEEKPLFAKHETLDFVLESSAEHPVLDLEFEPVAKESPTQENKPLDLEIEPAQPATPALPEITLDLNFELPDEKKPEE